MPIHALKRLALFLAPALLAVGVSAHAAGGEEAVRKAMEAKLGGRVDSVAKAPFLGLYEVIAGGHVLYTDESASAFIEGSMFDGKTLKNVTGQSLRKYYAEQFAKLPLDQAVKLVQGNGKRVMVTFEDPNCGYCKKLAHEVAKLDNVTVYTFLVPILSADSEAKSRDIWCANDRSAAWKGWMMQGTKPPAAKAGCPWNKQTGLALAQKFSVQGTPAMLFANGELVPGYLPAGELEKKLNGR